MKEVATVLDDVVQCKIDFPQIGFFLSGHQPDTKMINRRETLVIVSLCLCRYEERAMVIMARRVSILPQQAGLF